MAALVAAIHVAPPQRSPSTKDRVYLNWLSWRSGVLVGGRVKPGHDAFPTRRALTNAQSEAPRHFLAENRSSW